MRRDRGRATDPRSPRFPPFRRARRLAARARGSRAPGSGVRRARREIPRSREWSRRGRSPSPWASRSPSGPKRKRRREESRARSPGLSETHASGSSRSPSWERRARRTRPERGSFFLRRRKRESRRLDRRIDLDLLKRDRRRLGGTARGRSDPKWQLQTADISVIVEERHERRLLSLLLDLPFPFEFQESNGVEPEGAGTAIFLLNPDLEGVMALEILAPDEIELDAPLLPIQKRPIQIGRLGELARLPDGKLLRLPALAKGAL